MSYRSNDIFTPLSIGTSLEPYAAEFELLLASTRARSYGFDSIKLTARYLILDDVIGDPVSLTAGLSYIQPFKQGLKDPASFHHGGIEGEAHMAVGKEISCGPYWLIRTWGLFAVGQADVGSPWLRGDLHVDCNQWCWGGFGVFAKTLWGCGGKALPWPRFKGYGPVNHQSVDIGFNLSYRWDYGSTLIAEYFYRPYAKNFPAHVNSFKLTYFYPFGL